MKRIRSIKPKQNGQSLIELAMAIMILMWLLAGAIDLGMGLFTWISLRDAAEEGALFGSVKPTNDTVAPFDPNTYSTGDATNVAEISQRVCSSTRFPVRLTDAGGVNCDATRVTVNVTFSAPPCAGGWVRVDILYNYSILMPLTSTLIGSQTIPIRASATNTLLRFGCP